MAKLSPKPETDEQTHAESSGAHTRPDLAWFESMVACYEGPLLRYVKYRLSRQTDAAEDLVQETLLRLWRQVQNEGLESIADLSVWLFRVAHNLAIDHGRKQTRRLKLVQEKAEDLAPDAGGFIEDRLGEMVQREAGRRAMDELKSLPAELRDVMLLRVIQGLSMKQIAQVAGISTSNVCYRINRALLLISRRLKEQGLL